MSIVILILQAVYTIAAVGIALYGLNAIWLVLELLLRRPSAQLPEPLLPAQGWPSVTVQLPVYNERHVVRRLIDAIAALDYPRDRLEIQVLDDSDDATVAIAERAVAHWQRRGTNIKHVRRDLRAGFKAGALGHALPLATGEFLAIFDADFQPTPDFLKRAMAVFAHGPSDLAFVQGRWEHLNRNYSMLTRVQALALDGHFGVEQPARRAAGYACGFNGSAGVWRRAAIEDPAVGGWQADTLCEDVDLAYRAQLAGWRSEYVVTLAAPAEIPPQFLAFKRQQSRWAKGSIQALRKLGGRIHHSGWPLPKRLAAYYHLGGYILHPLLLCLLIASVALMILDTAPSTLLGSLSIAALGPPLLYALAQVRLHPSTWGTNVAVLPLGMLFGVGISLANSVAVWQGLRTQGGTFARTPKFDVQRHRDEWRTSSYRLPMSRQTVAEVLLSVYAAFGAAAGLRNGNIWAAVFLALFSLSFAATVLVELWQAREIRGPMPPQLRSQATQQQEVERTVDGNGSQPLQPGALTRGPVPLRGRQLNRRSQE